MKQRIQFGKLRVLNDDEVEPGAGFGTHPRYRNSTGHQYVIRAGEVQTMSAGTGITHPEYNASQTEPVNFLQIRVLPKRHDITPRYGKRHFEPAGRSNRLQLAVSPMG
jgi:redox-sensitive bicupin YhaK (pirin superfamily)